MVQALQPALLTLLSGNAAVTALLGSGANGIKAVSDFDADNPVPEILLDFAGGQKTSLPQFYEDWFVYVLDRGNGYYRIAGVMDKVKAVLDEAQPSLTGANKVFEIEWLQDLPWESSRAFRAEIGGSLYRVYLSKE